MKKILVTSVALAALIASPAFAKSATHRAAESYAAAPEYSEPSSVSQQPSAVLLHTPNDVYVGGQYLGADPDPQVRQSLIRSEFGGGSN